MSSDATNTAALAEAKEHAEPTEQGKPAAGEELQAVAISPPAGSSGASGSGASGTSGSGGNSGSGSSGSGSGKRRVAAPARLPKIAMLLLVLIILVVSLLVFAWHTQARIQQLTRTQGELTGQLAQLNERNSHWQERFSALQNKVDEFNSRANTLENLYTEVAKTRDERVLIEVEQALNLANQQLYLAGNTKIAVQMLKIAGQTLAPLQHPRFIPLQQAIADDINLLQNWREDDISGLSRQLQQRFEQISGLPLMIAVDNPKKFEQRFVAKTSTAPATAATTAAKPVTAKPEEQGWFNTQKFAVYNNVRDGVQNFWQKLQDTGSAFFKVRHVPANLPPVLTPDQAFFLRENVKLHLMSTRLSVITGNYDAARVELASAISWINHYFDTNDESVKLTLQALENISANLAVTAKHQETPPSLQRSFSALALVRNVVQLSPKPAVANVANVANSVANPAVAPMNPATNPAINSSPVLTH